MNSTIVTDSGSTRKPSCTLRPPAGNQSNKTCWNCRSCSGLARKPMNTMTDATNAPPHISVANQPASGSPNLRPASSSTRKPNNGSAGINQTSSTTPLALQHGDVIGGGTGAASHEGDDDAEADHHFSGGDDEDEEHDRLSADVIEGFGERGEGEVDGVEHELDAHEHHERVAPDHQPDGADREQERA